MYIVSYYNIDLCVQRLDLLTAGTKKRIIPSSAANAIHDHPQTNRINPCSQLNPIASHAASTVHLRSYSSLSISKAFPSSAEDSDAYIQVFIHWKEFYPELYPLHTTFLYILASFLNRISTDWWISLQEMTTKWASSLHISTTCRIPTQLHDHSLPMLVYLSDALIRNSFPYTHEPITAPNSLPSFLSLLPSNQPSSLFTDPSMLPSLNLHTCSSHNMPSSMFQTIKYLQFVFLDSFH